MRSVPPFLSLRSSQSSRWREQPRRLAGGPRSSAGSGCWSPARWRCTSLGAASPSSGSSTTPTPAAIVTPGAAPAFPGCSPCTAARLPSSSWRAWCGSSGARHDIKGGPKAGIAAPGLLAGRGPGRKRLFASSHVKKFLVAASRLWLVAAVGHASVGDVAEVPRGAALGTVMIRVGSSRRHHPATSVRSVRLVKLQQ
jgi:hypothetical protein